MPVLVVAVASYVTCPAPWQRIDELPSVKTGVPTVGVIVTVCDAEVGPPQPPAITVITDVPLQVPE